MHGKVSIIFFKVNFTAFPSDLSAVGSLQVC